MGRFDHFVQTASCGCDCGGTCGGEASSIGAIGDVYGDCDSFQVVLSAETVEALRQRLDGEWRATDLAVTSCASLSPEERAAWAMKLEAWNKSLELEAGILNANGLFRATCALGKDLEGWRTYMASRGCQIAGPKKLVDATHNTADAMAAAVKWVGIAVAIAAAAYVASPFLMPLAGMIPRKR